MKDIKHIPNVSVNLGKSNITSPGENLNVIPLVHGTSFRALVHGGNDFKNVPYDTFPNSSAIMLLSKKDGSFGYGSATFIAPRVILTCAHNFYNDDGTMKDRDFYYVQGHNSETNPGASSGVETKIDKSNIKRFSTTYEPVSGTDFCVAIVDTPCEFSYSGGTHTKPDNPSSNRDNAPISIIGYPFPNDVPQVSSKMKHGFLYESKGKIAQTFNDGTMIYDIDTLPGNSGSGVISNNKLIGVHIGSARYTLKDGSKKEYNTCVNIDSNHYNWLKKILDENKTTGWYDYEDNKYYYDENQELVKNKKIVIDGTYYLFDENGVLTDQGVDETPDNNTGTGTVDTTGGIDEAPSVDPTRNLTGDVYDHDERNTQSFRGNNYTHFVFFANTPLTNMSKYMNFGSNQARDEFFDTVYGKYKVLDISQRNFNMVRDRLTVNITYEFDRGTFNNERSFIDNMIGVNYCYFYDENTKKRFYCQVVKTEYVNDAVTKFYLAMDVLTTFFQGDFAKNIGTVHIIRQHLSKAKYKDNLYLLASRDKLQCSPPRVIKQFYYKLGAVFPEKKIDKSTKNKAITYKEDISKLYVVFQSSADLSAEFGTIDEPKLKTSGGTIIDYVTSPVDVYALKMKEANKYFDKLGDYPWIEQNIKNINIIPDNFIDSGMLEEVTQKSVHVAGLKKFKDGSVSKLNTGKDLDSIDIPFTQADKYISKKFSLSDVFKEEKHLFNSGYFKYFCTNWSGANLELQPEKLPDGDLKWGVKTILGYDNKIMFFPRLYNNDNENLYYEQGQEHNISNKFQIDVPRGEYIGASLMFNSWDTLPILIDNYKMSLANSAYDRKLSEENRLGNQFNNFIQDPFSQKGLYGGMNTLGTVFGGAGSAMTAGFGAGGLGGGLLSGGLAVGGNLLGNWKSEYEYYRNQKAQFDQMKIQRPTETTQNLGNSFSYKNGTFGVSVKLYAVTKEDYMRALRYHKSVGYQWDTYSKLDSVTTMSHVNYVQFDGDWIMGEIPSEFQQVAKQLFREGVSVYHNPNRIADPFSDDILNNKRVK